MAKATQKAKKRPEDSEGHPLLTRSEAAKMLGAHKTTVRRLENRGLLKPLLIDGVHYFSREAVARAAQARPHAVSGPAFKLFKAGMQPEDVVIELCADPDHIAQLWASYNAMLGNWVVKGPGSLKAWELTYKVGELTPKKLLRCLEIVHANPRLRAELQRNPA